jgi:hypothetical protein
LHKAEIRRHHKGGEYQGCGTGSGILQTQIMTEKCGIQKKLKKKQAMEAVALLNWVK